MTTLEMLLKYLSFPGAVIVIVVILALVFRKPLIGVIQRGGLKISKEGLSIEAAANVDATVAVQTDDKGNVKPPDTPSSELVQWTIFFNT